MQQTRKPQKIFYGWWIVISTFVISMMATGVVGYGFTAFFNPIVVEFGWSYAAVSLAASLRGAENGLMAPVLGFLVDRWGSKWILFAGSVITSLGLIILSRVSSLGQFYGIFVFIALGTSCCGIGVVNPVINQWFRRNLGKATGIMSAGFALGGLLIPVIYRLIEAFGWREALVILGAGSLIISVPLIFVVKNKPEQYGYLQDGDTAPPERQASEGNPELKANPAELNIGLKEALKSRTFWHITLAFTLNVVVTSAVQNHIMPYLKTVNIDGSTASFFAGAIPILSIFGRLGSGWLSDKFGRKQVTISFFVLISIGTPMFNYVTDSTLWWLVPAVILFSVTYGSVGILRAVLVTEYFGRNRFASLLGLLLGVQSLGSIIGPFLAGWTFDIWNSYHYAWIIFTGVNIIALALIATTPRVRVKDTDKTQYKSGLN